MEQNEGEEQREENEIRICNGGAATEKKALTNCIFEPGALDEDFELGHPSLEWLTPVVEPVAVGLGHTPTVLAGIVDVLRREAITKSSFQFGTNLTFFAPHLTRMFGPNGIRHLGDIKIGPT